MATVVVDELSWTPAFGTITGPVCDGGGMLSQAAIVGREYVVSTVAADGDEIEADGTVAILSCASTGEVAAQ